MLHIHINILSTSKYLRLDPPIHTPTRRPRHNLALLIDELPPIPRQIMWYRAQLRPIPLRIVIQLKKRHGQQLHVLRHAQNLASGQLDKVQLFTLFRSRDVRREVRVHEGFEVGPVPLGDGVVDDPVRVGRFGEGAGGRETFV